jgi:hypothetical protein
MAKQTFTTGQVLTAAQMTSLQQTAMGGGAATAKTASYVLTAADAGTVVQMNAAGATTITVNTALFAAGDSVQIQNIGAGVCTVTAGTATVTTAGSLALSQWEGGNLYFTSTGASIFFDIVQSSGMTNPMTTTGDTIYSSSGSTPARLGIGSTGQVLTVAGGIPSWATASSGGMTLLSTTTLSGASTTVTIAGGYVNLMVEIFGFTNATGDGVMRVAPNANAGAAFWIGNSGYASTKTIVFGSGDYIRLNATSTITRTNSLSSFILFINNYLAASSQYSTFQTYGRYLDSGGGGNWAASQSSGALTLGTAVTSLVFDNSGGNFSTGTVLVYGVK